MYNTKNFKPLDKTAALNFLTNKVRRLAYRIYCERLSYSVLGTPESDWITAENAINKPSSIVSGQYTLKAIMPFRKQIMRKRVLA